VNSIAFPPWNVQFKTVTEIKRITPVQTGLDSENIVSLLLKLAESIVGLFVGRFFRPTV